jgi:transposase InsO family protein
LRGWSRSRLSAVRFGDERTNVKQNRPIRADACDGASRSLQAPATLEAARRLVAAFVEYYNHRRLHSAIGFITPADQLAGRGPTIWAARDQKLEAARARRRAVWSSLPEKIASQNPLGPTIVTPADPYPSRHEAAALH